MSPPPHIPPMGACDSQSIELTAIDWVARADRGLTPEEDTELQAWMAEDARHHGALIRTMAVLEHFDGERLSAATRKPPLTSRLGRRELLIGGGALAASLAVATVVVSQRAAPGKTFQTAKGELRAIPLEDGSVMWLNTDSRVRVHYQPHRRDITLLRGEALFDVAKDATRPFVVRSQAVDVRAVGTSFAVRRLGEQPLQVLVREGLVDVSGRAAKDPEPTHLIPGCWARATEDGKVDVNHVGVPIVERQLAWREGKVDLDGVTLGVALRGFERYSDMTVVLDDPALAKIPVNGQFMVADPEGFAWELARQNGWHVRRKGRVVHLSR